MKNTDMLIVFFGALGLLCTIFPRLVYIFYLEIINLGSGAYKTVGRDRVNSMKHISIYLLYLFTLGNVFPGLRILFGSNCCLIFCIKAKVVWSISRLT